MSEDQTTASRRAPLSERLSLPDGTIPVGLGLLIAGACSFAFYKVGVWALGDEDAFKPVTALWFATFALAPGFFLPLEQELGRALSARRALGSGGRPVVHRVVRLGAVLATVVAVGLLSLGPWLYTELFESNWVMVVALVIAILAYAPAHLARGVCSGMGRFKAYGVVLGADGVMRILFCVIFAAFGVKLVGAYGLAFAVAPLVGVGAVAWKRQLRTEPGPAADWAEVTPNLGWLLIGSVMAALLVNAGPLALAFIAPDDRDADVTKFGYGVLMARIPLFMFQAVQAALLPRLSRLAALGNMEEFRRGFRRLMLVILAVGAIGVGAAYLFGRFAIDKLYDSTLSQRTLTVLALGSVCYMVALAAAQAVIALHGHALVAVGWTLGVIVFIVTVIALPATDEWLFKRVEIGVLAGSGAAMAAFLLSLRSRLRVGAVPDADSVFEAVRDMPLEA